MKSRTYPLRCPEPMKIACRGGRALTARASGPRYFHGRMIGSGLRTAVVTIDRRPCGVCGELRKLGEVSQGEFHERVAAVKVEFFADVPSVGFDGVVAD